MSKVEIDKTYRISVTEGGYEEVAEYYNREEGKVYLVKTAYESVDVDVTPETQTELNLLNQYIDKDSKGTVLLDREFCNIEFQGVGDAYSIVVTERQSGEELDIDATKMYLDEKWEWVDDEGYYSLPIVLTEVKVQVGKKYQIFVPKGGYTEYETYENVNQPNDFLYTTTSWRGVDAFVTIESTEEAKLLEYYITKDTTGTFQLDSRFNNVKFEGCSGSYGGVVKNAEGEEIDDDPLDDYEKWEFMECESYYECPIKIKEVE